MKETIIFESRVNIKKIKGDIQLTLTSTDIVLKKEKGLFKKEWKTIKEINLNDVVTNNNKIKIIETDVFIKTNKEEIVICFNDKKKARIFADKVVDTKIGENKFARGIKIVKNIVPIAAPIIIKNAPKVGKALKNFIKK